MARRTRHPLLDPGSLALVWGPLIAITALHYTAPHDAQWVHDVARRLFYLPIVFAGLRAGLLPGLLVAGVTLLAYTPHAFLLEQHHDPASTSQKALEMGFYVVLGAVTGAFSERLQRYNAQVRRKDAQLQRAARLEALGQLTAGLAHEIRNPLHAMKGTAEILLDFVPEEAAERKLATAHLAEIDRLSSVLSRFLDFARQRLPDVRPVQLGDVLDRIDELLQAQASQQETDLLVRNQEAVTVEADFDQLVQVVLAIAINALQAVERGGVVCLETGTTTRYDGDWGVMTVRNDGPPIPAEIRTLLFDPFVSTREEGTGLGLANAWRIVSDHGGIIEAENIEGWVEFRVLLPR
ncbi:MAG: hypothetical protein JRJ84_04780 [Deltaproteobacteria bacterium]|nr:hypothetical protein [Deltaproteobacteria bacterium]